MYNYVEGVIILGREGIMKIKGRFALWGNKEFELISNQHNYYLRIRKSLHVEFGFRGMKANDHAFFKPISVEELEDAYEIIPYVMILGHRFSLVRCDAETGKVMLLTVNPFVKEKMDVRSSGKIEDT